jgi:serine/threonine protein kinase
MGDSEADPPWLQELAADPPYVGGARETQRQFSAYWRKSRRRRRPWSAVACSLCAVPLVWVQLAPADGLAAAGAAASLWSRTTAAAVYMIPLTLSTAASLLEGRRWWEERVCSEILLLSATVIEAAFGTPYLLGGALASSSLGVLFESPLPARTSRWMSIRAVVAYSLWLICKPSARDELGRGGAALAVYIALTLLLLGLWLVRGDESVERAIFNARKMAAVADKAMLAQLKSCDGLVAAQLPSFAFEQLLAARTRQFPVPVPSISLPSISLPEMSALNFIPVSIPRLLGYQWDAKVVDRVMVTLVVGRVCGIETMLHEASLHRGGDITPRLMSLFDSMEEAGRRRGVQWVEYIDGMCIACAGLPTEQAPSSGSSALAAVYTACEWVNEGAAVGLDLCVGVVSGCITCGGLFSTPLVFNVVGGAVDEAIALAMRGDPGCVYMSGKTYELAQPEADGALRVRSELGQARSILKLLVKLIQKPRTPPNSAVDEIDRVPRDTTLRLRHILKRSHLPESRVVLDLLWEAASGCPAPDPMSLQQLKSVVSADASLSSEHSWQTTFLEFYIGRGSPRLIRRTVIFSLLWGSVGFLCVILYMVLAEDLWRETEAAIFCACILLHMALVWAVISPNFSDMGWFAKLPVHHHGVQGCRRPLDFSPLEVLWCISAALLVGASVMSVESGSHWALLVLTATMAPLLLPISILPPPSFLRMLCLGFSLIVAFTCIAVTSIFASAPMAAAGMLHLLALIPLLGMYAWTRYSASERLYALRVIKRCQVAVSLRRLRRQVRELDRLPQFMFPQLEGGVISGLLRSSREADDPDLSFVLERSWVLYLDLKYERSLEGMVSPSDLCILQCKVCSILQRASAPFGGITVRQSGGAHVIVFDGLLGSSVANPVGAMQAIEQRLTEFNLKHEVNLGITGGLTGGSVRVGFIGGRRISWGATGAPVRVAQTLALCCSSSTGARGSIFRTSQDVIVALDKCELSNVSWEALEGWQQSHSELEVVFELTVSEPRHRLKLEPQVDDFTVLACIGQGSYGKVFMALDGNTGVKHAVKVITKKNVEGVTHWMRVELQVLSQARHPNVIRFHFCLQSPLRVYVVMEYVQGSTLKAVIRASRHGKMLQLSTIKFWFGELALALEYIHGLGIIHRDVKPDNLLISSTGHLKLMDFGLSKVQAPNSHLTQEPSGVAGKRMMPSFQAHSAHSIQSHQQDATLRLLPASSQVLMRGLMPSSLDVPSTEAQRDREAAAAAAATAAAAIATVSEAKVSHLLSPSHPMMALLVDSSPFQGLMSKTILKQGGYKAVLAIDCERASKLLQLEDAQHTDSERGAASVPQHSVDVVLLDWTVPGALELLQSLRLQGSKSPPVVVLSSMANKDEEARLRAAGAQEWLVKPLHKDDLRTIESLVRRSRIDARVVARTADSPVLPPPAAMDSETPLPPPTQEPTMDEWDGLMDNMFFTRILGAMQDVPPGNSLPPPQPVESSKRPPIVGTPYYIAPEVLSERAYSRTTDWWSYGVSLYEATALKLPFTGDTTAAIFRSISRAEPDMTAVQSPAQLKHIILALLSLDSNARLGGGSGGAKEVKQHAFFDGIAVEALPLTPGPKEEALDTACHSTLMLVDTDESVLRDFYPDQQLPVNDRTLARLDGEGEVPPSPPAPVNGIAGGATATAPAVSSQRSPPLDRMHQLPPAPSMRPAIGRASQLHMISSSTVGGFSTDCSTPRAGATGPASLEQALFSSHTSSRAAAPDLLVAGSSSSCEGAKREEAEL